MNGPHGLLHLILGLVTEPASGLGSDREWGPRRARWIMTGRPAGGHSSTPNSISQNSTAFRKCHFLLLLKWQRKGKLFSPYTLYKNKVSSWYRSWLIGDSRELDSTPNYRWFKYILISRWLQLMVTGVFSLATIWSSTTFCLTSRQSSTAIKTT